jgi:hypothetical protein
MPCRSNELQPDRIRMGPNGLTINDPRPGSKVSPKRAKVQPVLRVTRLARDDAHSVAAYVFRHAFVRTMADVQAAEVHSYCQRDAFFRPVRERVHETPLSPVGIGRVGVGAGTTYL